VPKRLIGLLTIDVGNLKLGPLAAHWSSDLHTSVVGPLLSLLKKVYIELLLVCSIQVRNHAAWHLIQTAIFDD
jgi:hypothetical protein